MAGAVGNGHHVRMNAKPAIDDGRDPVARARDILDHVSPAPPLAELAGQVGLSAAWLQRSFRRRFGISPAEYVRARRFGELKQALRQGSDVTGAVYAAGFGSGSRVYEHSDRLLGMPPARYREGGAGIAIRYTTMDSPLGRVLVSTLDEKGAPNVVQKTTIRPPVSRLGPATAQERADIIAKSPVKGLYDRSIDRESAFERLQARTAQAAAQKQADAGAKAQAREQTHAEAEARRNMPRPSNRQSMGEAFTKSLVRAAASQAGRQLIRGVLGSLLK